MAIEQRRVEQATEQSRPGWRTIASLALAVVVITVGVQAARWRVADRDDPGSYAPDVPPAATAVAVFEARVASASTSFVDLVNLGNAYLRQARESSDASAYARADESARRALAINPDYAPAQLLEASVRLALHDFEAARQLAEPHTHSNNPAPALAIVFDAQLALGRYEDAAETLEALDGEASGPSVLVRRQGLLEAQGGYAVAVAQAQQALVDARLFGLGGEALVWYVVNTAELHLRYGEFDAADELFAEALSILPAYAPALAGRGRAALAVGDSADAMAWLSQAVAIAPQPEFLVPLLRASELAGDNETAEESAAQLGALVQLTLAGEGLSNRVLALYLVDSGLNVGAAQELAEREAALRSDVYTLDTLAWVRFAAGDLERARDASEAALAVGTQDPLILYHAAVIRVAGGDTLGARALLERCLEINKAFDVLHAPRAAQLLAELSES